jgi:hypothetical protein
MNNTLPRRYSTGAWTGRLFDQASAAPFVPGISRLLLKVQSFV